MPVRITQHPITGLAEIEVTNREEIGLDGRPVNPNQVHFQDGKHKFHPVTGCLASTLFYPNLWMIDSDSLQQAVDQASTFNLETLAKINAEAEERQNEQRGFAYQEINGVAVLPIDGIITKQRTSFSNVMTNSSSQEIAMAAKELASKKDIHTILMRVSSPGGHVAGSAETVDALRQLRESGKRVMCHFEDIGASLAYLYGVQAESVTSNRVAEIGSIGTMAVILDKSEMAKQIGVKVHAISTGELKGAGAPGTPITAKQLEYFQKRVDNIQKTFSKEVERNRKLTPQQVASIVAMGKVYSPDEAVSVGLIDGVCSFEEAFAKASVKPRDPTEASKTIAAKAGTTTSQRSDAMIFTSEQAIKARSLPGMSALPDDRLEQAVLEFATTAHQKVTAFQEEVTGLKAKVIEPPLPAHLETSRIIACERIDLLAAKGKIIPAQAEVLKSMMGEKGKGNLRMLTHQSDGTYPYEPVLKAFDVNSPNGLMKDVSGDQPAPRHEPGKTKAEDDDIPTFAQANEIRARASLPLLTKKQYEEKYDVKA